MIPDEEFSTSISHYEFNTLLTNRDNVLVAMDFDFAPLNAYTCTICGSELLGCELNKINYEILDEYDIWAILSFPRFSNIDKEIDSFVLAYECPNCYSVIF